MNESFGASIFLTCPSCIDFELLDHGQVELFPAVPFAPKTMQHIERRRGQWAEMGS